MNDRYAYLLKRIWKDKWFRELDQTGKLFWIHLLVNEDCKLTGIYELDIDFAAMLAVGTDTGTIESLMEKFVQDGKIKRDGGHVLVLRYTELQGFKGKAMTGAINEAKALVSHTELASIWLAKYAPDENTPSIPHPSPINRLSTQDKTRQDSTEHYPDSASPILGERELAVFEQCKTLIAGKTTNTQANRSPKTAQKTFRQLLTIEKVPLADIVPTLKWALDDAFWGDKLIGMASWRKDGGNGPKFWQAWRKWQDIRGKESVPPQMRDPRAKAFFAERGITDPGDADWRAYQEHIKASRKAEPAEPAVKPWELRQQQEQKIHEQRAEEARRKAKE